MKLSQVNKSLITQKIERNADRYNLQDTLKHIIVEELSFTQVNYYFQEVRNKK